MTTSLLFLIALGVLWLCLHPHAAPAVRRELHRRRARKVPSTPAPDVSAQLVLCKKRTVEHEIAWHGADVPTTYHYAGKDYVRMGRRTDGAWEYRR